MHIRNYAARIIQRNFHEYRITTLVPRTIQQWKDNAAITVQKYLRGYKIHK